MSKEKSSELRSLLKKAGYSSKQVSVRCRHYGSLVATIRDPEVDPKVVKELADSVESIRRDVVSGDILAGGNIFTNVYITPEVAAAWAAKYEDALRAAVMESDELDVNRIAMVGESRWYVSRDGHKEVGNLDRSVRIWYGNPVETAARMFAADKGGSFGQVEFRG